MDIILVPGFWLDASSWDEVAPTLEAAGHRPLPLTLPGLESAETSRAGIGLRDHIDAVTAALDGLDGKAVLVGHSGGGAIIHGVVDERPDKVERAIYVDSGPLGEGNVINDELLADGETFHCRRGMASKTPTLWTSTTGSARPCANGPFPSPKGWPTTSSICMTNAATASRPPSSRASFRLRCSANGSPPAIPLLPSWHASTTLST